VAELTPEERQRIYEEEKVRFEAQASLKAKQSSGNLNCCGGCAVLVGIGIIFILVVGMFGSSGSSYSPSSSASSSTSSTPSTTSAAPTAETADVTPVEYELATLYEGHSPSDGDPVVREFSNVLDSLETKCTPAKGTVTTRRGIGNGILFAKEEMDKQGVHETLLELAHHLDESIPSDAHHLVGFDQIAAVYITLRTTPLQ
jgi:hypothetical protein